MAEGHEDSFQKLNAALKQYRSGVAAMWDFTEEDINDLTAISFDYIRMGLPQDDIRDIFRKPGKNSSIFGNKDRWQRLKGKHDEIIDSVPEEDIDDESLIAFYDSSTKANLLETILHPFLRPETTHGKRRLRSRLLRSSKRLKTKLIVKIKPMPLLNLSIRRRTH